MRKNARVVKRNGRPSGRVDGKTSKYNALTAKETRSLVAEYSTMSNSDLRKKYNISETQLKVIVKHYKLKTKYVGKFTSKSLPIEFFKDKCGIYAIVRNDSVKAYIGSSTDIYKRFVSHISQLNLGQHDNTSLQNDWNKHKFYMSLICECEEKDLLMMENNVISQLDSWATYNTTVISEQNIPYDIIWKKIQAKLRIEENGCWTYTGNSNKGHGMMRYKNKTHCTHRISYMYHKNEFSYMVIHTCENKMCCNPDHLIKVSCKESAAINPVLTKKKSKLLPYKELIMKERAMGKTFRQINEVIPIDISTSELSRFFNKSLKQSEGVDI